MTETLFDLIIIGAGINGAGIARDAAMRGLKVLLLDKGDIGSGTSSWSTRLIHGGLRYLEHGEFGLVRESLRERETLLRIAPHLVKPLPLLIPIYDRARRGPWMMRAGMVAYDLLSFDKTLPHHRMLSRAEALESAPGLDPAGLWGAALYYDAQVEFAERLVLENVLSARDHGAVIMTHTRVEDVIVAEGIVRGVNFRSEDETEHSSAQAHLVINAAGPWVDQVLGLAPATDHNTSPPLIGGTKGSHIVVAAFAGAPANALYIEAETDQRPFFIIPWNDNYLIGTTDIRYEGDLDHLAINDQEMEYLLRETNRVIPDANLTREQILYSYSGVRPLPLTGEGGTQGITRRHFIRRHPHYENLFSIVGGKLTTYRNLSEEAVDLIFQKPGQSAPKCTTRSVPLPGASTDFEAFRREFKRTQRLSEMTSNRLLRIYGTRAGAVMQLVAGDPSLLKVFDDETGSIAAEVVFAFREELAETLADCLLRRTMVGLNSSCGLEAVEAAAQIGREYLSWSDERAAQEVLAYRKYVERFQPRGARGLD